VPKPARTVVVCGTEGLDVVVGELEIPGLLLGVVELEMPDEDE
jgi:hypothetical protein